MTAQFIIRRFLTLIVLTGVITVTTFFVMRLMPGDPAQIMLGQAEQVTVEDVERMRRDLGLDRPLPLQALEYFRGLVAGDLGTSLVNRRPVWDLIVQRFPATLELTVGAVLFSLAVGIPVGIIAAVRQHSIIDRFIMGVNFLGISTPPFWLGIMLIMLFSVQLQLLPSMGRIVFTHAPTHVTGFIIIDALLSGNWAALRAGMSHLILPSITLGAAYSAVIARILRSSMVESLRHDFVRTARSKGVSEARVVVRHAFRNALIPTITVVGLEAGSILSGNVIIETVFAWPGLGSLIVDGIFARDYPVVQSGVIILSIIFVFINFLVDVAYTVVDPRIRW